MITHLTKRMKQWVGGMTNRSSQTLLSREDDNLIKRQYPEFMVCMVLALVIFTVFWKLPGHDFVNMDDNVYVTENPYVQKGLTARNIKWAFTTTYAEFWHPLTWLSLMLDVQLFGLNPSGFLFTNLLLHVANTLLLFLAFSRMTGTIWQSGFVAVLFAIHPLHVESVAWIAERKDVLSTFFMMLTLLSYDRYVKVPGLGRYITALMFFSFGLMAKPMLVTLPFVLLLLDYWPLRRFQCSDSSISHSRIFSTFQPLNLSASPIFCLIREKIPLFVVAGGACAMTIIAHQSLVGTPSIDPLFSEKLFNALVSFISYIRKMLWPVNLSVFYPFPSEIPPWKVAGAVLLLIVATTGAFMTTKRYPYLIIGWLWYLGMLVPVIGLVQVGPFGMADRFTYIPLIGLFIIISWGVPELIGESRYGKPGLSIAAIIILISLMMMTRAQVRHWTNSITLYKHAVKVTGKNWLAQYNLGNALSAEGRFSEAIEHYRMAVPIHYNPAKPHNNMGLALAALGRFDEAVFHYKAAIRIDPGLINAYSNLAASLNDQNRVDEAMLCFEKALRIDPDAVGILINLGTALLNQGRVDEAIEQYLRALRASPNSALAHGSLGLALVRRGKLDEAVAHFQTAVRLNPDDAKARSDLNHAMTIKQNISSAAKKMREALRNNWKAPREKDKMEILKKINNELDQALTAYQKALSTQPGFAELDLRDLPEVYAVKNEYDRFFSEYNKINK